MNYYWWFLIIRHLVARHLIDFLLLSFVLILLLLNQHAQLLSLHRHCLVQVISSSQIVTLGQRLLTLNLLLFLSLGQQGNFLIIKVFELAFVDLSQLLISLQEEIIRSCHMIVFVCVNAFHCVIFLEVILH